MEGVFRCRKDGYIDAVLVGDGEKIRELIRAAGEEENDYHVVETGSFEESAAQSVRLIRDGEGDFLIKGKLSTPQILRAVVDREHGIQTGRLMSHLAFLQLCGYERLLVLTDSGMVIHPTLEQKREIVLNAVDALRFMGYEAPNVGVVCTSETVNPKMPETVDVEQLVRMNPKWRHSRLLR